MAENNIDVNSADKVRAFAPPTISQVFSHISKNNSDFLNSEDFKQPVSLNRDFSLREKNTSNLQEIVEDPKRGDTIIDAKFFYNEENFFKYDEVTNAKKDVKEQKPKNNASSLPPLDKKNKKRKAKSSERQVKMENWKFFKGGVFI